jgi:hypothetical protein
MNKTELITFKCPCGETIVYENPMYGCLNLGDCKRATGWHPYITSDCANIWVCPTCADRAAALAAQIVELIGTERVTLQFILR